MNYQEMVTKLSSDNNPSSYAVIPQWGEFKIAPNSKCFSDLKDAKVKFGLAEGEFILDVLYHIPDVVSPSYMEWLCNLSPYAGCIDYNSNVGIVAVSPLQCKEDLMRTLFLLRFPVLHPAAIQLWCVLVHEGVGHERALMLAHQFQVLGSDVVPLEANYDRLIYSKGITVADMCPIETGASQELYNGTYGSIQFKSSTEGIIVPMEGLVVSNAFGGTNEIMAVQGGVSQLVAMFK